MERKHGQTITTARIRCNQRRETEKAENKLARENKINEKVAELKARFNLD
ncbi:hypothetical protein H7R52_02200 [Weissella confusa]|uniref:Uncharacterized protein n=1 Tax=Weissella confusa TaxID=1583 RepID=A0A923NEH9_WEICO|nr:hypothetical protein [Weissella confusa]